MTTYYKVLGTDGSAFHGGHSQWHLPHGQRPGKWMPKLDQVVPCESGYHLCREQDLLRWLGPTIFVAEGRGEMVEADDKVVFAEARLLRHLNTWNDRTARLFACDRAESVVHLTNDERCVHAIAVARRYANREASPNELAAAWDAAWAAAGDAARDAARAAARAAAWAAAGDAAWAAAWAAAGATAWDAAGAAAWDAAWAAARDPAWDAARDAIWAAAGDAAWAAAWAAARDAARAAAWDAARAAQTARLVAYLNGDVE